MQNDAEDITFKDYIQVLKDYSPYDFSDYSDNSISRRIQKVMRDYKLSYNELIYKTKTNSDFAEQIVEALAVNTTELFRDPSLWTFLLENVYPTFKRKPNINIWHAGCSSGQEVYSNLVLLDYLNLLDKTTVYGTDISRKVLEQAKKGVYKYNFNKVYLDNFIQVFGNKPILFQDYFEINESEDKIIVKDIIKDKAQFIKHDLIQEQLPFFNKFDIIFCRNVLIYFNIGLQSKVIDKFYQTFFSNGTLILGTHETISGFYKTKFIKNGFVFNKSNAFHLK